MIRARLFAFTLPALMAVGLAASSAQAATELYLQFDPVLHGASKEPAHSAWITVDAYAFGDGSAPVASGAGDKGGGLPTKGGAGEGVGGAGDKGGLPTKGGAGADKGGAGDKGGLPTKGASEGMGEKGGAGDKGGLPTKITVVTSDASVLAELRAAVARGTHFKNAVLEVKKPGKGSTEYLKITMTEVLVTSMQLRPGGLQTKSGAASFMLTFVKETAEYSKADAGGGRSPTQPMPTGWDLTTQKAD
jgi:type VI protein secretion system component Hcp